MRTNNNSNKQKVYVIKNVDRDNQELFSYLDICGVFRYADFLELDTDYEQPVFFITNNFDSAKIKLKEVKENDLWKEDVKLGNIFIEEIEISAKTIRQYIYKDFE